MVKEWAEKTAERNRKIAEAEAKDPRSQFFKDAMKRSGRPLIYKVD